MEHLGRWASVDVTGRLDSVENIYIVEKCHDVRRAALVTEHG